MASKATLLVCLYLFSSPKKLFIYLRRRYSEQQVQVLNRVLELKGKCVRTVENISFLGKCLELWLCPNHIRQRVGRARAKNPSAIERAFIRDEVNQQKDFLAHVKRQYHEEWVRATSLLTFLDLLRFSKLLSKTALRLRERTRTSNEKTLKWLRKGQHGSNTLLTTALLNLSDAELSDVEKEVLCRGLKFGIPPTINKEEVLAEFELCWRQLSDMTPLSPDRVPECKAEMTNLAYRYANAGIDRAGFPLEKNHFKAIENLKKNKDIVITKQDKGNGVVILNRRDYVKKMDQILLDRTKFRMIGDADAVDNTALDERALQAFLLRAKNVGDLPKAVYERIRPVGSTRPRMYGLPKVHKEGVPLRPILSMINSPHHEMAKWLGEVLQPVVKLYAQHTVSDAFQFCSDLETFAEERADMESTFMCSFDIVGLFTNVPLDETIDICMDALYRNQRIARPPVEEKLLRKMLKKATTEVEFSFNNILYRQIDGVAMGSPLGPVLANIFVGYCETRIPAELLPFFYRRYVDDTFSIFANEMSARDYFHLLNELHPSLRFTMESETNGRLPYLDVAVHRRDDGTFERSIYRKPTFTGLYTRWDSFCDTRQKIGLVRSLTSRAIKICSEHLREDEFNNLRRIFEQNGYPRNVINNMIRSVVSLRTRSAGDPSDKLMAQRVAACVKTDPVVLRLPWLGRKSHLLCGDITRTVERAYPSVMLRVVFASKAAFPGTAKDVLPTTMKSSVIYNFGCCCGHTYVGKTTQQLCSRIQQHVPAKLLQRKPVLSSEKADSAITKHLKAQPQCIAGIKENVAGRFTILARGRNKSHLDVLEALHIKARSPSLCLQKDTFVRQLQLL